MTNYNTISTVHVKKLGMYSFFRIPQRIFTLKSISFLEHNLKCYFVDILLITIIINISNEFNTILYFS